MTDIIAALGAVCLALGAFLTFGIGPAVLTVGALLLVAAVNMARGET